MASLPLAVVAVVAVVAAAAALAGAPAPQPDAPLHGPLPRALRGHIPTTLPTRKRIVALTFDAGADDAGLPRIYATLRQLRTPATFFVTGHFAEYYPSWTRRIASRYPICNHTVDHVDLTQLSDAHVRAQVAGASRTLRRVTGSAPQPLFRFPYGVSDARRLRLVNSLGDAAVGWTVDTGGWLGVAGGQSVGGVIDRALAKLRPGAIILMHVGANPADGTTLDARALATVIERIRRRGYSFVSLPDAYAALYPAWAR